jgi:hypothetical protein
MFISRRKTYFFSNNILNLKSNTNIKRWHEIFTIPPNKNWIDLYYTKKYNNIDDLAQMARWHATNTYLDDNIIISNYLFENKKED